MARLTPHNAFQLADLLVGDSSETAIIGRASRRAAAEVGLTPDEQIGRGPGMKMAEVAALAGTVEHVHKPETVTGRFRIELKVTESSSMILPSSAFQMALTN